MRGVAECWCWPVCFLAPPFLHTVMEWTLRCSLRPWSSEFQGSNQGSVDVQVRAVIERVWRCTWRPWSCELGGHDRASLEAITECVWNYRWRLRSGEFGDTLGGCDRASLEMHFEAVIVRDRRCTWRPWSCELGGCNRPSIEIHLVAVIEPVWRCTWRPWWSEIGGVLGGGLSEGSSLGGRRDGSWDSIHWLTCHCGNIEHWVQHGLLRDERLAGNVRQSILGWCKYKVHAVLSECCTMCKLYSVLTLDHGMER